MAISAILTRGAAAVLLASMLPAQGLESLSASMLRLTAPERYGVFLASLVDISRENELAASRYRLEGGVDTKVELLSLPFRTTLATGNPDVSIFVEGIASYLRAEADIAELFEGTLPGFETSVRSEWEVGTASLGAGPRFAIDEHFALAPILVLGISHIRNEALLAGAGASVARAALDDVLFNWNASSLLVGASLRAEGRFELGDDYELQLTMRHDFHHVEAIRAVDELHEFDAEVHKNTTMARVLGPTGWRVNDRQILWHAELGHRMFFANTHDVLGVDQFWEFGTGVELDSSGWLGPLASLRLSGAIAFAHDVSGWSIGFGVSF